MFKSILATAAFVAPSFAMTPEESARMIIELQCVAIPQPNVRFDFIGIRRDDGDYYAKIENAENERAYLQYNYCTYLYDQIDRELYAVLHDGDTHAAIAT